MPFLLFQLERWRFSHKSIQTTQGAMTSHISKPTVSARYIDSPWFIELQNQQEGNAWNHLKKWIIFPKRCVSTKDLWNYHLAIRIWSSFRSAIISPSISNINFASGSTERLKIDESSLKPPERQDFLANLGKTLEPTIWMSRTWSVFHLLKIWWKLSFPQESCAKKWQEIVWILVHTNI